jgi:hypothetical protein
MATPRYRLAEKAYVKLDHTQEAALYDAGTEFDYSGPAGRTWIPLNDEAAVALSLLAPLSVSSENVLPHRGTAP